MAIATLNTYTASGVTLVGASSPTGVAFAFTERKKGVSEGPYASLNLGSNTDDAPEKVLQNRRLALKALGAHQFYDRLVCPQQIHGTNIVYVRENSPEAIALAQHQACAGADALVVSACDVPALMCFADCVPVIIVAEKGFALAHSGWRGTLAKIAGKTASALAQELDTTPQELSAYIGPCIRKESYQVDFQLAAQFKEAFGSLAVFEDTKLDLAYAVMCSLIEAGLPETQIIDSGLSTSDTSRFFSYRKQNGICGRHGALAIRFSQEGARE